MVFNGERINGRHEKDLGRAELLAVFLDTEDYCVIMFNKGKKIIPQFPVRIGQVDVAPPDPGAPLAEMLDHRQRLRVSTASAPISGS
jgi:hypothetical protein